SKSESKGNGKKNGKKGKKAAKRDYKYEDNESLFGLVQIEVKGAKDLPRFKNMLKTGFDMDPFTVVSFGKKVFRTRSALPTFTSSLLTDFFPLHRVVRHSLNPVWDEKLFFPVRRTEANWIVAFNIYDWDKMSSNDHVGDVSVPLAELIGGKALQPDENGLYPATSEGRLVGDEFYDHELKVLVDDKDGVSDPSVPTVLHIRAKFTPYDALRQQFLRLYLRQYDIDENGAFSHLEIFSMLDSLGSTLSKETITSFFTRFGKTDDQELTTDEVILCLEHELRKPKSEKRPIDDSTQPESGTLTPGDGGLGFTGPPDESPPKPSDPSKGTEVLAPGMEVVTNQELGTVVKQPLAAPSRNASLDPSEDSSTSDTVERVINIKECPLCHKPRMNSRAELDIVTHMGICSSTDPRSINRIVVGEYVTASQAQRKWFTKVISKATKGAYSLGANSANIIIQDRQTGMLQEEKMAVYVRLAIRLMYKGMGAGGGMEGARIRRMLESMSIKQGAKYDSPSSVREIAPFIAFHNLNMDEALEPVSSFKTFNEFFYRKLKPGAREIDNDPNVVVSPADCRSMFFPTVNEATKIWIKGRDFSISKLLGEGFKDKAHLYEGASLAIFRLAPQDYHRFHSPVDGVCGPQKKISGQYYTVNPMAIRSSIDVYGDNVRLVEPIVSPVFGEVMNIWVGAMMVGSICMTVNEGDPIKRGEECGYFAFGGSTIVVLFPPKSVVFDPDLVLNSQNSVETLIRMGSRIGCKA
ncbi:phosphatidylserine decarboxylase, partial [Phenoliferia sp. Uapishka_3]